jgi:hypothetical protein
MQKIPLWWKNKTHLTVKLHQETTINNIQFLLIKQLIWKLLIKSTIVKSAMSHLFFHKINLFKFHSLFKETSSNLYTVILYKMDRIRKIIVKIMIMFNKMKDINENKFRTFDKKISPQKFCMDFWQKIQALKKCKSQLIKIWINYILQMMKRDTILWQSLKRNRFKNNNKIIKFKILRT